MDSSHSNHPGYHSLMVSFFVECNLIREACNHLLKEAVAMNEVSMNATIAAGHTGSYIRTFTEIAKQIGNSSRSLSDRVDRMRGVTSEIVNHALYGLTQAQLLGSLEKCVKRVSGEKNKKLIEAQMNMLRGRIYSSVNGISEDLQKVRSDLKSLDTAQRKAWATSTRLKIEASLILEQEKQFVIPIAERLSEIMERMEPALDHLQKVVEHFQDTLNSRETWNLIRIQKEEPLKNAS